MTSLVTTTQRRASQRRRAMMLLTAGAGFALSLFAGAHFGNFRINLTPSEPLGLWRVVRMDRPATVGDLVFVCPPNVDRDVRVDGVAIEHSKIAKLDGKGRRLLHFPSGVVPLNRVFLHSAYPGSYDSRYFGPIPQSGILGLAQEVLTYAP
jgi:type IV secretory pathway protease TraF